MPTSATGTWTEASGRGPREIGVGFIFRNRFRARKTNLTPISRGFTLIEILVVVVIIAIVASVAVISVNALGRDTEIGDETRRLSGLIGMVREQAEMEGRDYGLRLEEGRYDFLLFDVRRNDWLVIDEDRLLRPRELPEGLRLRLWLEGREVVLRPPPDRKTPRPPQITLLSSGDITAFELRIVREGSDHEAHISADAAGKVEVRAVDEATT
ncbi:MAG TPA: type II secretion system minor pseudopilin GspH [Steroidobacteraceae bacterium]|nr:type II secretion system minor pseudopilin GspH [Steroidobacteraceae bacterium]